MSGTFNTPAQNSGGAKEYVGYCSDSGAGPIVVTVLNSLASNYLGDITWSLNDITSITGTTPVDTFTIYTFLIENKCTTSTVADLKVNRANVDGARSITLSYSGGLGTIHGMFKIIIYPGAFPTPDI